MKYQYKGIKLDGVERQTRMKSKRNHMSEQNPAERSCNFKEVNQGYNEDQAVLEASRCLLCPGAPCVSGCPVHVRIPEILERVSVRDFDGAVALLKSDNALPAVTGRVCPQESQCEGCCTLGKAGNEPVGIGYVERFLADYERTHVSKQRASIEVSSPKKRVAVVGSGPGGLTVAADLARAGHEVHIFEAFHKAGGVLIYGIPEFRLPKDIVEHEINNLKNLGVIIHTNHVIGTLFTVDELLKEKKFDAVYVGIGAGLPKFMGIDGENLNGVYSANEYLTRVNLMKSYLFPAVDTPVLKGKRVAVVGGGNVAMDAVRTARRLGADEAILIYRRSREEMPAREEEIKHAEEEGVQMRFLCNPLRLLGDKNGWVRQAECIRMELGAPDSSGRRRAVEVKGSEFLLDLDLVIVAVGTSANPLLTQTTPDLLVNKWGNIVVDEKFRTSKPGVFAGGDIARGAATVILAMGDGREAAVSINDFLTTGHWPEKLEPNSF